MGSSFWKRPRALEKFPAASRVLGVMARLITGSGTFIDVIVYLQPQAGSSIQDDGLTRQAI